MANCPICDLPGDPPNGDRWQGNDDNYCERFHLSRSGLQNDFATRRCVSKGQAWRKRFLASQEELAETKRQLKAAQKALSRHHDAQLKAAGQFRDGARIT